MKILIISDVAPPFIGGGESYVIHLGKNLVRFGHEVHWMTARAHDTPKYENYEGIHIHRVPIIFSKKFFFPGRQTFPLTAAVGKFDFIKEMDIIQTNTLVAGFIGWKIAKKYGKPSLLYCHEFFGELWKTIGQNMLEQKVYPIIERKIATSPYDWYACPSEYSKSTLINAGAPADRITVIPHGIDHEMFNSQVDGEPFRKKFGLNGLKLFGYIGRLRVRSTAQSKNLVTLLKATKRVVKALPDSRLVLAGSGFHEVKPIIRKLDIEDFVVYLDDISYDDNPRFLRMCDIIVCPALSDGFCFMLAEASACGKPILATRVGAHVDRVLDNKNGILVEPTVDDMAKSLTALLKDSEKLNKLGTEGEVYARNFTWDKATIAHIKLYEQLLEMYR